MSIYAKGQWNAICDLCGFKFKSSELKTDWRGLKVCHKDYEQRHPQELIRVPNDDSSVPWTRSTQINNFILFCTIDGSSSVPNKSIPNCMIPNKKIIGNLI